MLVIGSHVGFTKDKQLLGSLEEALSYGANTFMFYTGAPQNTARYPINDGLTLEALELMKKNNIDYSKVTGLRLEAREKLSRIRPDNFGRASRISGVSPADISVLMIYAEQNR